MDVILITLAVFLVSTALILCILYFWVAAPATDKALRARIRAIQDSAFAHSDDVQTDLLRHEVLSELPGFQRLLVQVPGLTRLGHFLQQAGLEMRVGRLISITLMIIMAVVLVGLLLNSPFLWVLAMAGIGGGIPYIVIAIKRRKRFSKFDEQFPGAIDLLARAVRAGHAFTTGLELIASEMPDPVSQEFRRTYEQQNLGLPIREALQNLLVRVPLPDVHVFVTALVIQREAGGNLAEILDNLSNVIRERFKLMHQVKVFTAQGRMSLYVLTAMPPLAGLGLYAMNPSYVSRLFIDPLGQKMLIAAICLQIIGYLVINKIVQPKV